MTSVFNFYNIPCNRANNINNNLKLNGYFLGDIESMSRFLEISTYIQIVFSNLIQK